MIQRIFILIACGALVFSGCSDDDDPAPQEFSITVNAGDNGTATANVQKAVEGTAITLTATPAEGYEFSKWTVLKGGAKLSSETTASATFTMPAADVEVSAAFTAVAAPKYSVKFADTSEYNTLTADPEEAEQGKTVTISFSTNPPSGLNITFQKWEVAKGDVVLASETSETTTFVMPAEDVELQANYVMMTDGPQP